MQRILVTGGSRGIGFATCQGLLAAGCSVVLTARTENAANQAADQLRSVAPGTQVRGKGVDFSSLVETARFASELNTEQSGFDVIVLNAGIVCSEFELTEEKVEKTFAVNHLSQLLLLCRMFEHLKPGARVILVASQIHANAFHNEFQAAASDYNGYRTYCESKLANILISYELARRWQAAGVRVNSLHPGVVETGLISNLNDATRLAKQSTDTTAVRGLVRRLRRYLKGNSVSNSVTPASVQEITEAAQTTLYLALHPRAKSQTGKYFKYSEAVESAPVTYDEELAGRFLDYSLNLIETILEDRA